MTVYLECEERERCTNIGIAKALSEILEANDLQEIAKYLLIFAEYNT